MKEYRTVQRKILTEYLSAHRDELLSAEKIAADTASRGISLSSVYRNIQKMTDDGLLKRFATENGHGFVYQYIASGSCREHLHMKCLKCGKIYHMDHRAEKELTKLIADSSFSLDESKTTIYGTCKSCL